MILPESFLEKINKNGPVPILRPDLGPCWLWTASKDRYGYGQFRVGKKLVRAHGYTYRALVGPVPRGFDLDHLCRVRHCCNPKHTEPATRRINLLRGQGLTARNAAITSCPKGHPYNEENTRWCGTRRPWRLCRECGRQGNKRRYRARKSIRGEGPGHDTRGDSHPSGGPRDPRC